MSQNRYLPGQGVRISVAVTSFGAPVDPDTVTAYTLDPTGSETTYSSPVRDGVGLYHQDFALANTAASGTWLVKWVTTGSTEATGVVFDEFDVDPLMF